MTETWYILYTGTSEDGAGPGKYAERTTSAAKALRHFARCAGNPYSTGYVLVVTDSYAKIAFSAADIKEP